MSASENLALAVRHHRAGRVEEAEQCYRATLETDPENTSALFNLAALMAAQGRFD